MVNSILFSFLREFVFFTEMLRNGEEKMVSGVESSSSNKVRVRIYDR